MVGLLNMPKSESEIQGEIMDYLKDIPNSKTIRLDGQGLLIRGRVVKKNKTYLDILFLYKSQAYFFEVKTASEKEFILKHKERLLEGGFSSNNVTLKRYKSQIEEVNDIRLTGNVAEFVCSLEEVKQLIN